MDNGEVQVVLEGLNFDLSSYVSYLRPDIQFLNATVHLRGRDGIDDEQVGSVGIQVCSADSFEDEYWRDVTDLHPEWVVGFGMVEIERAHLGKRYGLRLVAEALSEISFGRTCWASIVAEPKGWESLKQRDRGPAIIALDRHWARLGFDGGEVRSDIPGARSMGMIVRDYAIPAFLQRGLST